MSDVYPHLLAVGRRDRAKRMNRLAGLISKIAGHSPSNDLVLNDGIYYHPILNNIHNKSSAKTYQAKSLYSLALAHPFFLASSGEAAFGFFFCY